MTSRRVQGTGTPAHDVPPPVTRLCSCVLAVLVVSSAACARPVQEWDVMSMPAVCDSVASPARPGEPVGATLPPDVRPSPDSGTAIGTVTEAGSGRTMQGTSVVFLSLPVSDSTRRPRRGAITSATGGFEVRALVPGAYRLRVSRIGQLPHEQEIDVRAGVIDTFVVQLRPWRCRGY